MYSLYTSTIQLFTLFVAMETEYSKKLVEAKAYIELNHVSEVLLDILEYDENYKKTKTKDYNSVDFLTALYEGSESASNKE